MAKHVMTPARRAALRKAQLVSAQKRHNKRKTKTRARTKVVYKNGITYKTTRTRYPITPHLIAHETTAYRRGELIGYATSRSSKKRATFHDLYVAPSHRGKGVSNQLIARQAHSLKGKQVKVTGTRTVGGNKALQRHKVRGFEPTVKKQSRMNSDLITSNMNDGYKWKAQFHRDDYNKQIKRAHKAAVRGRRIKAMV